MVVTAEDAVEGEHLRRRDADASLFCGDVARSAFRRIEKRHLLSTAVGVEEPVVFVLDVERRRPRHSQKNLNLSGRRIR